MAALKQEKDQQQTLKGALKKKEDEWKKQHTDLREKLVANPFSEYMHYCLSVLSYICVGSDIIEHVSACLLYVTFIRRQKERKEMSKKRDMKRMSPS